MTDSVVDIVLPVRFPAPWLSQCIASIREQQSQRIALIVSVHGDPAFDDDWDAEIDNLLVVHSSPSATLSDVLNRAAAVGTSPYIARIDADDVICQDRLRLQVSALEANETLIGVGSDAIEIDENGIAIGYRRGSGDSLQTLRKLAWRNPIIHPSMTFRRSIFEQIGGYSSAALLAEDYDLWLRMAACGDLKSIPTPLIRYRVHPTQTSRQAKVGAQARRRIKQSQLSLAAARGRSEITASTQHGAWALYHMIGR